MPNNFYDEQFKTDVIKYYQSHRDIQIAEVARIFCIKYDTCYSWICGRRPDANSSERAKAKIREDYTKTRVIDDIEVIDIFLRLCEQNKVSVAQVFTEGIEKLIVDE